MDHRIADPSPQDQVPHQVPTHAQSPRGEHRAYPRSQYDPAAEGTAWQAPASGWGQGQEQGGEGRADRSGIMPRGRVGRAPGGR